MKQCQSKGSSHSDNFGILPEVETKLNLTVTFINDHSHLVVYKHHQWNVIVPAGVV